MSSGIYSKLTGYHNRRSIRLPGYDYSRPGYYFVTICIQDRKQNLFGDVTGNRVVLNDYGFIVQNELLKTEQMRINVKIDEHIVMPNHVHIIFGIREIPIVGAYGNTPLHTWQYAPTMPNEYAPATTKRVQPNQRIVFIAIKKRWRVCSWYQIHDDETNQYYPGDTRHARMAA